MRYAITFMVVVLALVAAPAAQADQSIVAGPNTTYLTPNVTISQGEPLTFYSFDISAHDVSSTDKGPDGKPLFSTPLISFGDSSFVDGSQYLTTGAYPFICTVHSNMRGTITVSSGGTPVPRPGPGNPAPTDTTKPGVKLKIRSSRLAGVRRPGKLLVELSVDEAAVVSLKATAKGVTLATKTVELTAAGTRRETLKLTRAGKKYLAGRSRAKVTLTARATDRAANIGTAKTSRALR